MATITASLERSLQKCSLDQQTTGAGGGGARSKPSNRHNHDNHNHDDNDEGVVNNASNASSSSSSSSSSSTSSNSSSTNFVELNSHISLPYHWEQCLDLKTGELYYINWSNRMKVREDPRTTTAGYNGDYESEEEDEDEDEDDGDEEEEDDDEKEEEEENNVVGYDHSEGSSTESYQYTSSTTQGNLRSSLRKLVMGGSGNGTRQNNNEEIRQDSVLVVAGCKSCLMYHMVPKHQEICPKCSGQLLHFPPNPAS